MKRKPLIARLLRPGSGQSLVEFAMVLPLLLGIAFIITEFGRALWVQNVLTVAAGNGARAAATATSATYQAKAQDAANHVLDANKMGTSTGTVVTATLVPDGGGNTGVKVRVTRDFSFIPGSAGKGSGFSASPFEKAKDTIGLGTFSIAGEALEDILGENFDVGG